MGTSVTTERRSIQPEAISPDAFAHFVLRTSNLEGMRRWYQKVLKAEVVHDNSQDLLPDV